LNSINEMSEGFIEVKRSKFIAYLVPISGFKNFGMILREENPKANHIVYAYRTINDNGQVVENSSDDGEPKGCAGVPVLNALRGKELVACGIYIVRYFGGIKLGTGGMARAYAQAANDVISKADLNSYHKMIRFSFETPYNTINRVLYLLGLTGIRDYERIFENERVRWMVSSRQELIEELQSTLESERIIAR